MKHKKYANALRSRQTEAEKTLWYFLRDRRFSQFKFRRQVPIGSFIVDFVCHEAMLIIECDGGQHNEENTREYDQKRTKFLERVGYRIIRFWNNDILIKTEVVLGVILKELHLITPHPNPLPQGERGYLV